MMNKKFCISIQISLKFVLKGLINNKSALVQVMAWCRTGNKPLPESMLTLFTHAYMQHLGGDRVKSTSTDNPVFQETKASAGML